MRYQIITVGERHSIIAFDGEKHMSIPDDEANSDYQQYLAWVEEGNAPEEWNPEGDN